MAPRSSGYSRFSVPIISARGARAARVQRRAGRAAADAPGALRGHAAGVLDPELAGRAQPPGAEARERLTVRQRDVQRTVPALPDLDQHPGMGSSPDDMDRRL